MRAHRRKRVIIIHLRCDYLSDALAVACACDERRHTDGCWYLVGGLNGRNHTTDRPANTSSYGAERFIVLTGEEQASTRTRFTMYTPKHPRQCARVAVHMTDPTQRGHHPITHPPTREHVLARAPVFNKTQRTHHTCPFTFPKQATICAPQSDNGTLELELECD